LQITREVASALDYAHEQGVVHRDIKPENILLSAGKAVVADFGIARAVDEAGGEQLTATGMSVGTPAYMSPEQAAGEKEIDSRTDLYALGCVLCEMLTGEPPFTGPSPQMVMARKVSEPAPSLKDRRDGVSEELEAVVLKALARKPEDRYETAGDLDHALTAGLPRAEWVREGRRSRIQTLALAAAVLAVIALGVSIGMWITRTAGEVVGLALDPDRALVLPFRGSGGGEAVEEFRSTQLLQLMYARLNGEGAPRAVSTDVSLAVWDRLTEAGRVPTLDDALAEARKTGAGQLWWVTVIGAGESVEMSGQVFRVADETEIDQHYATGAIDTVFQLADRFTLGLLPGQAGERQSLEELTTTSLQAYQTYLAGREHYRLGRFDSAGAYFARALQEDSTFALAAFYEYWAVSWGSGGLIGHASDLELAQTACRLASRLAERERVQLPCGDRETQVALLERLERAVELAPDTPEAWYVYGDQLFHWGRALGVPDWSRAAARALDRADSLVLALSNAERDRWVFSTPGHRPLLALWNRDTLWLRTRLARLEAAEEPDRDEGSIQVGRWLLTWVEGDTATGREITRRWIEEDRPQPIYFAWRADVIPADVYHDMLDAGGIPGNYLRQYMGELSRGQYERGIERFLTLGPGDAYWGAQNWRMRADALGIVRDTAAEHLAESFEEAIARDQAEGNELYARYDVCISQLWRYSHGDFSRQELVQRFMHDSIARSDLRLQVCAAALSAMEAHASEPWWPTVMMELDSAILRTDLPQLPMPRMAALIAARIHAERGDLERALAAARRRHIGSWIVPPMFEATFWRVEGDLARQLGDTAAAIDAYEMFLRLRYDPSPRFVDEVEGVKNALVELVGNRGRE
jgi:serine/threonine-protein kinase